MSLDAISLRTVNASGVSVGTSLAMESLVSTWPVFDPARVAPPKINLGEYTRVWINLWTLARNFLAAIPTEYRDNLKNDEMGTALVEEAAEIARVIKDTTAGAVSVTIYYPSYNTLASKYPKGKVRESLTEKQKLARKQLLGMMDFAAKSMEINHKGLLERFDVEIRPKSFGNTLVMTHFPVDLLSEYRFGRCALLESHTGVVKKKNLWYTKLFQGKQYPNLPFNAMTLQVFGDDHHFHPWESKIKQAILDIAQKNRWSWATTASKARMDLRQHPDRFFVDQVTQLL